MTAHSLTLHLGVPVNELPRVLDLLRGPMYDNPALDGDGWNAWGEPIGTDANDLTTMHLTYNMHGKPDQVAARIAFAVMPVLIDAGLVSRSSDRFKVYGVLTDADDWSTVHRLWA